MAHFTKKNKDRVDKTVSAAGTGEFPRAGRTRCYNGKVRNRGDVLDGPSPRLRASLHIPSIRQPDMSVDLMSRARCGDRDALIALLDCHDAEVRAIIERRLPADCRPMLAADDVLQETYFDVIQDIQNFAPRDERSFAAWLTCIAIRKLALGVRALRTAKRRGNAVRVLAPMANRESTLLENLTEFATHSTPSSYLSREEALA